jgi:hypothetical protein
MERLVKKRRLYKSFPHRKTENKSGLSPSQFPKRKREIFLITKGVNITIHAIFVADFPERVKKLNKRHTSFFRKFEKWFDFNFGCFFVNGRKVDSWNKKIDEKYEDE